MVWRCIIKRMIDIIDRSIDPCRVRFVFNIILELSILSSLINDMFEEMLLLLNPINNGSKYQRIVSVSYRFSRKTNPKVQHYFCFGQWMLSVVVCQVKTLQNYPPLYFSMLQNPSVFTMSVVFYDYIWLSIYFYPTWTVYGLIDTALCD